MFIQFIAEFLGTFFFLGVVLAAAGEALPVAIALGAAIFLTAKISGGHLNPAISTMFFVRGDLDASTFIGYITAQVLGGLAALFFYNSTLKL